jgi:hypothetical protein
LESRGDAAHPVLWGARRLRSLLRTAGARQKGNGEENTANQTATVQ